MGAMLTDLSLGRMGKGRAAEGPQVGAMAGREGCEGTRGGDGNVLYLDCGGGYLTLHVSK